MRSRGITTPPEYADGPDWEANFDNPYVRGINTAWNLLLNRDFSAISFRDIAKANGLVPQALYHYIESLDVLAEDLAIRSFKKMENEILGLGDQRRPGARLLHTVRAVLKFASARPHHYALMYSPRFKGSKAISVWWVALDRTFAALLTHFLRRPATPHEVATLHALISGGGARIATGASTTHEELALITRTVVAWRRARRRTSLAQAA